MMKFRYWISRMSSYKNFIHHMATIRIPLLTDFPYIEGGILSVTVGYMMYPNFDFSQKWYFLSKTYMVQRMIYLEELISKSCFMTKSNTW